MIFQKSEAQDQTERGGLMPTATPDNMISEEEFEQIYKENYESFIRYATTIFKANGSQYVSASGRAEEAVQEMCAVAWENRDKLSAAPSPLGWMYTTLQFKVRELLREDRAWMKRLLQISEQYSSEDEETYDFRLKAEMEDIIKPKDYLLLKRLYLDGYTYTEVGAAMGLKTSALAMRVKRIKEEFISKYFAGEKFSQKKCEQSPPGGQYIVEEVHGDGT